VAHVIAPAEALGGGEEGRRSPVGESGGEQLVVGHGPLQVDEGGHHGHRQLRSGFPLVGSVDVLHEGEPGRLRQHWWDQVGAYAGHQLQDRPLVTEERRHRLAPRKAALGGQPQ
jgi:hypothetical protein